MTPRGRQFLALFGLGFLGVLSLLPVTIRAVDTLQLPPDAPPRPVLVLLSVVQPAVLVAIAVALGLRFAPRLGLRSYIVEAVDGGLPVWTALRRDLGLSIVVGAITMAIVVALDVAFRPFLGGAAQQLDAMQRATKPAVALVTGILYGGITEEILMRWGLLSLLASLGFISARNRREGRVSAAVMWAAIVATAILFGIGHLPALSQVTTLAPPIVVRTVLLNALAGVAFGWLFWRRSLEAAMVAHATGHVVLFVVRLATR